VRKIPPKLVVPGRAGAGAAKGKGKAEGKKPTQLPEEMDTDQGDADLGNDGGGGRTPEELRLEGERMDKGDQLQDVHEDDREEKARRDEEHTRQQRLNKEKKAQAATQQGGKDQKAAQPQTVKKLSDGFERIADLAHDAKALATSQAQAPAAPPPKSRAGKPDDPMTALHNAQEPGVYFKLHDEGGHHGGGGQEGEENADPELMEALAEAAALLKEVKGVTKVTAGRNDQDETVIVVVANRGFTQGSLKAVPEKVRRFATLLALPYDLLPLRRDV
jgi:hypothetical protein